MIPIIIKTYVHIYIYIYLYLSNRRDASSERAGERDDRDGEISRREM